MRGYRMSQRWGRFKVSGQALAELASPGADAAESPAFARMLSLLSQVLIFHADHCPASDAIEYLGISRHFEELEEGEQIPEYLLEGQTVDHGEDAAPRYTYEVKAFKRV